MGVEEAVEVTLPGNGQFPRENPSSDISPYPARLALELGVGLV